MMVEEKDNNNNSTKKPLTTGYQHLVGGAKSSSSAADAGNIGGLEKLKAAFDLILAAHEASHKKSPDFTVTKTPKARL